MENVPGHSIAILIHLSILKMLVLLYSSKCFTYVISMNYLWWCIFCFYRSLPIFQSHNKNLVQIFTKSSLFTEEEVEAEECESIYSGTIKNVFRIFPAEPCWPWEKFAMAWFPFYLCFLKSALLLVFGETYLGQFGGQRSMLRFFFFWHSFSFFIKSYLLVFIPWGPC